MLSLPVQINFLVQHQCVFEVLFYLIDVDLIKVLAFKLVLF
jgi:hypothetical protein